MDNDHLIIYYWKYILCPKFDNNMSYSWAQGLLFADLYVTYIRRFASRKRITRTPILPSLPDSRRKALASRCPSTLFALTGLCAVVGEVVVGRRDGNSAVPVAHAPMPGMMCGGGTCPSPMPMHKRTRIAQCELSDLWLVPGLNNGAAPKPTRSIYTYTCLSGH